MPTRRIMEVALITAILIHPAWGLVRLWAAKTLGSTPEGTVLHGAAEIITVMN